MTLTFRYINPLMQFNHQRWDLCVMAGDTLIARFDKSFSNNATHAEMDDYGARLAAQLDDEMIALAAQAEADIAAALAAQGG